MQHPIIARAAPGLQLPWPTGLQYGINGGNTYGCDTDTDPAVNYYGIDFQFQTIGDQVTATAAGTVTVASIGSNQGAGNYVVVDHGGGYTSRYLHLRSTTPWPSSIYVGAVVSQGQVVGYSGNTPNVAAHLHFDMQWSGSAYKAEPMSGISGFGWYGFSVESGLGCGSNGHDPSPYWTSQPPTPMMIINGCGASYWNNALTMTGWTNETVCGDTRAIALAGSRLMIINGAGAAFAKDSPTAGWSQLTAANDAQAIAVGSSGLMMIINACGAAYSKSTLGMGGWTGQTACGDAKAIAVGGSRLMVINGVNAAYAKDTIGPPWYALTNPNDAQAIAVGSSGLMMLINGCGASYSNSALGMGGWTNQTSCNDTKAIAIGGARMMIVNGASAAYGKDTIGPPWYALTNNGDANAIAVGASGRMMVINAAHAAWGKDGLGLGGWTQLTANSDANKIAVQG